MVERIKSAKRIAIMLDGGENQLHGVTISADPKRVDMKKLAHDIGLAFQSAIVNAK